MSGGYGGTGNGDRAVGDDKGQDGRQFFDDKVVSCCRFDAKDPEVWLETAIKYFAGRSWEMVGLLEWAEGFQLNKILWEAIESPMSGIPMQDCDPRILDLGARREQECHH